MKIILLLFALILLSSTVNAFAINKHERTLFAKILI